MSSGVVRLAVTSTILEYQLIHYNYIKISNSPDFYNITYQEIIFIQTL